MLHTSFLASTGNSIWKPRERHPPFQLALVAPSQQARLRAADEQTLRAAVVPRGTSLLLAAPRMPPPVAVQPRIEPELPDRTQPDVSYPD